MIYRNSIYVHIFLDLLFCLYFESFSKMGGRFILPKRAQLETHVTKFGSLLFKWKDDGESLKKNRL